MLNFHLLGLKFVHVTFDHFQIECGVLLAPNRFIVWLVESVRVGSYWSSTRDSVSGLNHVPSNVKPNTQSPTSSSKLNSPLWSEHLLNSTLFVGQAVGW